VGGRAEHHYYAGKGDTTPSNGNPEAHGDLTLEARQRTQYVYCITFSIMAILGNLVGDLDRSPRSTADIDEERTQPRAEFARLQCH
jgi:hypothetical protein